MFARVKNAIAARSVRHRVYQNVMALDDRMLVDIGINLSEIGLVAKGGSTCPRVEDLFGLGATKVAANRNTRRKIAA